MDIKELLLKNINLAGIGADLIDQILEPALNKVVADSENKLDDMVMASMYPKLEEILKDELAKALAKLTKKDETVA